MSLRLPISCRNNPSAMGLRQMLPVQTKRTFFTMAAAWSEPDWHTDRVFQPKVDLIQVNQRECGVGRQPGESVAPVTRGWRLRRLRVSCADASHRCNTFARLTPNATFALI